MLSNKLAINPAEVTLLQRSNYIQNNQLAIDHTSVDIELALETEAATTQVILDNNPNSTRECWLKKMYITNYRS